MASRSYGPANIDSILASTLDKFNPQITDNIFNGILLLRLLKQTGNVVEEAGGDQVVETLMYAKNTTFKSITKYGLIDVTVQDTMTQASWPWRLYAGSATLSLQDIRNNEDNEVRIFNILEAFQRGVEISAMAAINVDLFTATASTAIDSLATVVGTGTYGNVAGGTYKKSMCTCKTFSDKGNAEMPIPSKIAA